MIDLYYWTTPNGHKITMFLEEAGLPYTIHGIDIGNGDQHGPAFLEIAPNNKIPAIVDREPTDGGKPISIFESGAILIYLADKAGKLIPQDIRGRMMCLEWLFWQVGGLGPMAGQNSHFSHYAKEKVPYAIDRFVDETHRLYGVLERHLAKHKFVADTYSIADISSYTWIVPHDRQGQTLDDFPHVKRWFNEIAAMPSTHRAYDKAERLTSSEARDGQSHKAVAWQST